MPFLEFAGTRVSAACYCYGNTTSNSTTITATVAATSTTKGPSHQSAHKMLGCWAWEWGMAMLAPKEASGTGAWRESGLSHPRSSGLRGSAQEPTSVSPPRESAAATECALFSGYLLCLWSRRRHLWRPLGSSVRHGWVERLVAVGKS